MGDSPIGFPKYVLEEKVCSRSKYVSRVSNRGFLRGDTAWSNMVRMLADRSAIVGAAVGAGGAVESVMVSRKMGEIKSALTIEIAYCPRVSNALEQTPTVHKIYMCVTS